MAFKMKGFSAFTNDSGGGSAAKVGNDARKLAEKKKSKARIEMDWKFDKDGNFIPGPSKYYDDEGKEYTEYVEGFEVRNVNDPVPSPSGPDRGKQKFPKILKRTK